MSKFLNPIQILTALGRGAERYQNRIEKRRRVAAASAWLQRNSPPFRVNVGCGREPFHEWINLDLDSTSKADILWDVTDGLPFLDGSCDFIYSEHFLEHLPVNEGVRFLKESRRSLTEGGVLRIAMPSLQEVVRQYYENDWAQQPWLAKYGYTWIKTRSEWINIGFREWGHQWLYDDEELVRRLGEAGFQKIEKAAWGESAYPQLRHRETRPETQLIYEAAKNR